MVTCPCQIDILHVKTPSNRDYQSCCQPFHAKLKEPQNALELMRSRYSAYHQGLVHYIMETTDPLGPIYSEHPTLKAWEDELHSFCKTTQFLGLHLLEHYKGKNDHEEIVEFEALLHQVGKDLLAAPLQGKRSALHERSLFRFKKGRWYYHAPLSIRVIPHS